MLNTSYIAQKGFTLRHLVLKLEFKVNRNLENFHVLNPRRGRSGLLGDRH